MFESESDEANREQQNDLFLGFGKQNNLGAKNGVPETPFLSRSSPLYESRKQTPDSWNEQRKKQNISPEEAFVRASMEGGRLRMKDWNIITKGAELILPSFIVFIYRGQREWLSVWDVNNAMDEF